VSVGQGCKAKKAHAGDPTSCVLLTPLAPQHTLTEIEHAPMLEHPPRFHGQVFPLHRDLEVRPIGKHSEYRPELRGRIIGIDAGGEGGWL
jgi:hypothetical protein